MKQTKEKQTKEQPKEEKPMIKLFKRMAFDWFLLLGLYLPYMIFTIARFLPWDYLLPYDEALQQYKDSVPVEDNWQPGRNSVVGRSISGLAWRLNIGWGTLAFYLIFTIGFMIYQAVLFTRLNGRNHKKMNIAIITVMIVGAVLLVVGSFIPISNDYTYILDRLHSIFCPVGTVIMVAGVAIMLIQFCISSKGNWRTKSIAIGGFAVLTFLAGVGIWVLPFFSALFSLVCTFMAMIYVHYFTVTFELTKMN